MKRTFILLLAFSLGFCCSSCKEDEVIVRIAVTTDVHGMIFPFDFIQNRESNHSLAHIHAYAQKERARADTLFFLMDNGDFLQGQPTVYYYNFLDTTSRHLAARVMNKMGYAAGTVGNHDIEAGPAVYQRLRKQLDFPWLAANAVYSSTQKPFFEPYTLLEAGKRKIAVLGLITPGIPKWLPKSLWPEMEFHDMAETAAYWLPYIREKENPDLMVGLFHAGTDASYGGAENSYMNENATLIVAESVPGFDVIFAGHDHRNTVQWVRNVEGDSVLVIDPGSHGRFAGEATIRFGNQGMHIEGRNVAMDAYRPDSSLLLSFRPESQVIQDYLNDTVCHLLEPLDPLDALFGPSALTQLIHNLQLELSGADLSFAAPLSLGAVIPEGPLLVSDMFKLYRFENMLYRMELSGHEIDAFLEHAAADWFNQMQHADDPLLHYAESKSTRLAHPYYNFSSGLGIHYEVNVLQNKGDRIEILEWSDGRSFHPDSSYQVALNSYRGNGGGGHLTLGSGIDAEELESRVNWTSPKDLRFHLMTYLQGRELAPIREENWSLKPSDWTAEAARRERLKLENLRTARN